MSGSEVQKDMPACIMNSNWTASRVIIRLRTFSSEASPTIWSCYVNLNNLFLYKLIPYLVHKNRKICIARMGLSGIRMLRRVLQGKVVTLQYFTSPSCPMDLNRCVICMLPCPTLNYFLINLESIRSFSFSSRWSTKCCFLNEPNSVSRAICLARLLLLTADTVAVRFWYVYFINNVV